MQQIFYDENIVDKILELFLESIRWMVDKEFSAETFLRKIEEEKDKISPSSQDSLSNQENTPIGNPDVKIWEKDHNLRMDEIDDPEVNSQNQRLNTLSQQTTGNSQPWTHQANISPTYSLGEGENQVTTVVVHKRRKVKNNATKLQKFVESQNWPDTKKG